MKKTVFILLSLALTACNQAQEKISPTATLITNANIVDVRSGKILENRNVVIDSGRIQSILESVEKTDGYKTTIVASGKFLMPGLAEMHAHIPPPSTDAKRIEETLFLYLSNGITTIRGMLGDPMHLELRKKASNGEILSPRIFTSSPSLNGNSVTSKENRLSKSRIRFFENPPWNSKRSF